MIKAWFAFDFYLKTRSRGRLRPLPWQWWWSSDEWVKLIRSGYKWFGCWLDVFELLITNAFVIHLPWLSNGSNTFCCWRFIFYFFGTNELQQRLVACCASWALGVFNYCWQWHHLAGADSSGTAEVYIRMYSTKERSFGEGYYIVLQVYGFVHRRG